MNPVEFGVFITPQHADIQRLRDLVHTAEAGGFDYVSIQDHPYSPEFLDTFALIGTLLGQTSRLRFMPNVANLPLRPPAMLAKTIATLDLLSDGRFELGLGGGRLWPQITGLGGPRLTPGEVVTALDEAKAPHTARDAARQNNSLASLEPDSLARQLTKADDDCHPQIDYPDAGKGLADNGIRGPADIRAHPAPHLQSPPWPHRSRRQTTSQPRT
jgi:hypothetical protein